MGFQDALYMQDAPYCSDAAVEFANRSMEVISYYAINASSELAKKEELTRHTMALYGVKESSQKIQ